MKRIENIENDNLAEAWLQSIDILLKAKRESTTTIITSINGCNNTKIPGNKIIETELNKLLKSKGLENIENTSSTIFPRSLWNRNLDRDNLYKRYENIYKKLKTFKRNRFGIYFNRMINFENGTTKINQLEHLINCWNKGTHRFSALQISIFNPVLDHNFKRQHGFPCLQQISILPEGSNGSEGINLIAYYPKQLIIERAYGNFIGLYGLGQFLAKEMSLEFKRLTCINVKSEFFNSQKFNKTEIKEFYNKIKYVNNELFE